MTPTVVEHNAEVERVAPRATDRLIFALDVPTLDEARSLVKQLDGVVSFFKIGLELYTATGLVMVPELVDSGKKVFLDLKYNDVPETVKSAVEQVVNFGVSFLTIHGNGRIVEAAVRGRGSANLKLLSVTALTSLDSDDMRDLGSDRSVKEYVMYRTRKAIEAGCDGVITSPNEAGSVRDLAREMRSGHFLIVTPGIRPLWSRRDDHKRYDTPRSSIEAGADYLVVGRPIKDSANPRESAEKILAEMQDAFDRRLSLS